MQCHHVFATEWFSGYIMYFSSVNLASRSYIILEMSISNRIPFCPAIRLSPAPITICEKKFFRVSIHLNDELINKLYKVRTHYQIGILILQYHDHIHRYMCCLRQCKFHHSDKGWVHIHLDPGRHLQCIL